MQRHKRSRSVVFLITRAFCGNHRGNGVQFLFVICYVLTLIPVLSSRHKLYLRRFPLEDRRSRGRDILTPSVDNGTSEHLTSGGWKGSKPQDFQGYSFVLHCHHAQA